MHAAVRRSVPRRYVGASLAIVTAAAVAVAPVTASVGAVTAPSSTIFVNPATLVNLQTRVAGTAANLVPRVAAPAATAAAAAAPTWGWGDVEFLATTLEEAFAQVRASLSGEYGGGVQQAFEQALASLKAGSASGAYRPIGSLVETTAMIAVMAVLFPVSGEFNPKLGALGKGLDAAFPYLIPLGQSAFALTLRLPGEILAAGEVIAKAVLSGDVTGVGAAVSAGIGGIGKFLEANLTDAATGLIPNLVNAGSAVLGEMLPKLPADARADALAARAAVASAPALGMPDFATLFETWKLGYDMFASAVAGDQWSPGVVQTITDALATLGKGDAAGAIGDVTDKAKALSIIVLLAGVMPVADLVNPYLGPIGKGLVASQPDFIAAGNAALAVLFDTPGAVVGVGQNLVTALLSGDPSKALTGLTTDVAGLTTFLNTRLFVPTDNPFDNALLPALSNIGKNIIDAFGPATPSADAKDRAAGAGASSATPTATVADGAAPASRPDVSATVVDAGGAAPATPSSEPAAEPVAPVVETDVPVAAPAAPVAAEPAAPSVGAPAAEPAESPAAAAPAAADDSGEGAATPGGSTDSASASEEASSDL